MKNYIKIICLSLLISSCVSFDTDLTKLMDSQGNPVREHKVELDPGCLSKATLYVPDSQSQCAIKGELRSAIEADAVSGKHKFSELGDITAGTASGRQSDSDIIIADLTGTGVQDTAIATLARQRAEAAVKGTTFNN